MGIKRIRIMPENGVRGLRWSGQELLASSDELVAILEPGWALRIVRGMVGVWGKLLVVITKT